ncbi:1-acyl-sn-glycerol-3-phosphate acyltransferase [Mycolicibacterium arenosum]|uniref:1-acyl-sn-glycerol-3-phosphate acyltransferase n=1 Tax=Mycolicibacterium arenosum TaxID=2952157 RepID=A0ABT1LVN6_9MYCO|nr:1-acyl-sn-glycerol-3-phosphate acyltransferase [Mycolicibacterium sp. CAU 1645]MCP9270963.1 1-acyl-sn-glycerol-3-phosphate acyltransferase [Mycolicibacterium sp. CAU 1645]
MADQKHSVVERWDPGLTKRVVDLHRPIVKTYFRSEVLGLDNIPSGPALMVANHSGGLVTVDMSVFAVDYYKTFGYERPLFGLAHDNMFRGPLAGFLERTGVIRATPEHAAEALAAGGLVLVFPGGDYDAYRPTARENVISFGGRTGYVTTAITAGVPIVPAVSIGGQENQWYLTRLRRLASALRLTGFERRMFRTNILPVTIGFPFGVSVVLPVNMPLPTKIVTQVLPPIDIAAEFGEDPDVRRVDAHVRAVMQHALVGLARKRRLPVIG